MSDGLQVVPPYRDGKIKMNPAHARFLLYLHPKINSWNDVKKDNDRFDSDNTP